MHTGSFKLFCYIDCFDKSLIYKLSKTTSVIYRNYDEDLNIKTILKIKKACNNRNIKFYLSNNIKTAMKLNLDGAYIPSFNKDLSVNSYSLKKNFLLLGSAHNLKEIRLKEQQNIDFIFLSPLFTSKKNKKCLGIYKFLRLKNLTRKKMICLGGINSRNLKMTNLLSCYGVASISFFKS
tara:strand:+ start:605 stop:1141 length:537 start_codon:yes stop_codon:yes gene_type:complete